MVAFLDLAKFDLVGHTTNFCAVGLSWSHIFLLLVFFRDSDDDLIAFL